MFLIWGTVFTVLAVPLIIENGTPGLMSLLAGVAFLVAAVWPRIVVPDLTFDLETRTYRRLLSGWPPRIRRGPIDEILAIELANEMRLPAKHSVSPAVRGVWVIYSVFAERPPRRELSAFESRDEALEFARWLGEELGLSVRYAETEGDLALPDAPLGVAPAGIDARTRYVLITPQVRPERLPHWRSEMTILIVVCVCLFVGCLYIAMAGLLLEFHPALFVFVLLGFVFLAQPLVSLRIFMEARRYAQWLRIENGEICFGIVKQGKEITKKRLPLNEIERIRIRTRFTVENLPDVCIQSHTGRNGIALGQGLAPEEQAWLRGWLHCAVRAALGDNAGDQSLDKR